MARSIRLTSIAVSHAASRESAIPTATTSGGRAVSRSLRTSVSATAPVSSRLTKRTVST